MSGGSLDYFYCLLQEHVKDFDDKELNELVTDLARLFHDREWFLSGDTGEGDWNESRDVFKEKWFTEHGRQERIEKYLAEFAEEVRRQFGISIKYCMNCKHWAGSKEADYGDCDIDRYVRWHRKDSCDKWEAKE